MGVGAAPLARVPLHDFPRPIPVPVLLVLPLTAAAQDAEVTSPELTHMAGEYRDFNIVAEDGTLGVPGCCGDH